MLPVNCGSHSDYQNFVVENLRKYYPNPDSIARSTWDIIDRFWNLDLSCTDEKLKSSYSVFGPKPRTPSCMHRSYMLVASDSESDLPVFPLLNPASRHDSHGFLHAFFRMKSFLPEFQISKLLLDSAHDAMPVYKYCKRNGITPFIDLNEKQGIKVKYKDDFTIGKDGVPVCKEGRQMNHDGSEPSKNRIKFRCPLASRKYGCSCEHPCSDSKYGRTVHLATKDNPRLINIPPRDSDEWKTEFNARTSAERSNKREKYDFLSENGIIL